MHLLIRYLYVPINVPMYLFANVPLYICMCGDISIYDMYPYMSTSLN